MSPAVCLRFDGMDGKRSGQQRHNKIFICRVLNGRILSNRIRKFHSRGCRGSLYLTEGRDVAPDRTNGNGNANGVRFIFKDDSFGEYVVASGSKLLLVVN